MKTTKNRRAACLFLRLMACALGAGAVVGCAQPAADRIASEPSGAKSGKVAVVSLLGDVFHASHIGASIFSKQRYHSDIPQWKIDERAEAIAADIIGRGDQHHVLRFNPNRESFARVYGPASRWTPQTRDYDLKKIAPLLTAAREKYGIDTLVLVLNDEVKDPTDKGSNLRLVGYGLYHNDWLGVRTVAHLFARLLVVDTQSGRLIAEADLSDFTRVDNKLWHKGLKRAPSRDREILEREIMFLIESNVIGALAETGFASLDELGAVKRQAPAGDAYQEAAHDLYRIFGMQRLFVSYTRTFVNKQLAHNTDSEIYADIYRRWMRAYFRQARVVSIVSQLYQSRGYTLDELRSIAVLAKNKRTREGLDDERIVRHVARQAWEQLATPPKLNALLRAMQKRRALIQQEANRALSL